jgi:hypothetical protein
MRERKPAYASGSYLAVLACSVGLVAVHAAYVRRTGTVPGAAPPFRATPDHRPAPFAALDEALARGEPVYCEPAYPPATNVIVYGSKGADGRLVPLAYAAWDGTVVTLRDDRGRVTWRARRPDEVPSNDQWPRPYEPAMDFSKSLAELMAEFNARLLEANRQNPRP